MRNKKYTTQVREIKTNRIMLGLQSHKINYKSPFFFNEYKNKMMMTEV